MSTKKPFVGKSGFDSASQPIINVADPSNPQDAATKNFASNAANLASGTMPAARLPAFTGDATSVVGTSALTLANTSVTAGAYGSATQVATLTVDGKGRLTAAASVLITPAWANVTGKPTTLGGYGITDAVNTNLLGTPNGVATLGADGRLLPAQMPAALVGALVFQGTWNASTNTPALANGVGTKGNYYKVSVAGATSIDGQNYWQVGDLIIFDGTVWDRVEGGPTEVTTVAGRVGNVVLTASDIGGLAASATSDTTVANNITSGTLSAARLPTSGVTAGTYGASTTIPSLTVDATGRITGVVQVTVTPAWGNITGKPTTLAGYGITDAVSNTGGVMPLTNGQMDSSSLTTSTTTANQVLDAKPIATYRGAKYIVEANAGTAYQMSEVLVMHDGVNAYISEYGTMQSGSNLITLDADVSGGNLRLLVTPVNASTTIRAACIALNV